ncbi:uncharacterized protein PAC_11471 [Phialocephala subalpina]|uniref:Uncharacterized protein n=1 Tax=Phialocephala subalpina TaxID=576137 RepID=A0A1L7X975_9HELO|nr:uncharacterized protein PAC_11471 [Phialocephala subalpina]
MSFLSQHPALPSPHSHPQAPVSPSHPTPPKFHLLSTVTTQPNPITPIFIHVPPSGPSSSIAISFTTAPHSFFHRLLPRNSKPYPEPYQTEQQQNHERYPDSIPTFAPIGKPS